MRDKLINIDEGLTYDYVLHGAIVLVTGILLSIKLPIVGIPLGILGIVIIAIKSGLQADIDTRRIRKYFNFLGYKRGLWKSVNNISHAKLLLSKSTSEMLSRTGTKTIRVRSYDLIFYDKNFQQEEYHCFTSYSKARQFTQILMKEFDVQTHDAIASRMKNSQISRRR